MKNYKLSIPGILSLILLTGMIPKPALKDIKFHAAGVLPITTWVKTGPGGAKKPVKYIVLARERGGSDKGTWDAFSGKRDAGENHPIVTAAREFYEEANIPNTLHWNRQNTTDYITLKNNKTESIVTLETSPGYHYVTYITFFPHNLIENWRRDFAKSYPKAAAKYREKDAIAVARWDELQQAIAHSPNKNVQVSARIFDFNTLQDQPTKTVIKLRPILAKTLHAYMFKSPTETGADPRIKFYRKKGVSISPKVTKPAMPQSCPTPPGKASPVVGKYQHLSQFILDDNPHKPSLEEAKNMIFDFEEYTDKGLVASFFIPYDALKNPNGFPISNEKKEELIAYMMRIQPTHANKQTFRFANSNIEVLVDPEGKLWRYLHAYLRNVPGLMDALRSGI